MASTPECYLAFPSMRNSVGMRLSSLIPRPVQKIGEKGLVSTVVHVLNLIPNILEILDITSQYHNARVAYI